MRGERGQCELRRSTQVRTKAAVVSESSSAAITASAGTRVEVLGAVGKAVTSLIIGSTAAAEVGAGTAAAAAGGAANRPNWGAMVGAFPSALGRPYPVSDLGGIVGATPTEKPAPPAGTEVMSL